MESSNWNPISQRFYSSPFRYYRLLIFSLQPASDGSSALLETLASGTGTLQGMICEPPESRDVVPWSYRGPFDLIIFAGVGNKSAICMLPSWSSEHEACKEAKKKKKSVSGEEKKQREWKPVDLM